MAGRGGKPKQVNSVKSVPVFLIMMFFSRIHSFIPAISIAPLQVLYYSEALPTTARISEFHAEAHRQLQVKDLPKVTT